MSTASTFCTSDNGILEVTATGGTAPLMYSIDGGATFQAFNTFSGLSPDGYTVIVRDAGGCQVSESAVVNAMAPTINVSSVVTPSTSCVTNNGTVTVTASGGAAPLTYSIPGVATSQSSNVFNGLAEGTFTIIVTDDGGCTVAESISIGGPSNMNVVLIEEAQTNCNFPNGGITIAVTGGVAPYTYSINGGNSFVTSNFFVDLQGGNYIVNIRDAVGCETTATATVDFPSCFGAVGDFVFVDANGDGIQDPGEIGVGGVRVELFNSNDVLVSITLTDSNGRYLFDEVLEGDYYVRFVNPEGFQATEANRSNNTGTDSNVDDSNGPGTTAIFNVVSGQTDLTIDYGIYQCIPIGQRLWYDFNENDLFDENENGINGVKVELFRRENGSSSLHNFTFTGADPNSPSDDGYYKFCAPPGTYYLRFNTPVGRFVRAVPNVGFNDNIDSDITDRFGPGTTDEFVVESGQDVCNIDGAYYLEGTVSDFIWFDNNLNGLRDDNEEGLENIQVLAMNMDGEVVSQSVSDSDGNYRLGFLPKGQYFLEVQLDDQYMVTIPNEGSDDNMDSDIDGSNGPNTSPTFQVLPGENVENVSIGVVLNSLPVEWLDIRGEARDDHNFIEWDIASEVNVSHYELQYSHDNTINFETVGEVESEETNFQGFLSYNLSHTDYNSGLNYYRVKQLDLDGRFSYSDIVVINNEKARGSSITIYPNPTSGLLNVDLNILAPSEIVKMNLYDNLGRLIVKNVIYDEGELSGLKKYTLDTDEYLSGIYTLEIQLDNEVYLQKIVVNK